MRYGIRLATTFAAFAIGGLSSANASIVAVTYHGTVITGFDGEGFFGPRGAPLDGFEFKATYLFDTDFGVIEYAPDYTFRYGGTDYGTISPSLGSSIFISGSSLAYAGGRYGALLVEHSGPTITQHTSDSGGRTYMTNWLISDDIPWNIAIPYSARGSGGGWFGYNSIESIPTYGQLESTSVTVSIVPEPHFWILLLTGFCIIGFKTRRSIIKDFRHISSSDANGKLQISRKATGRFRHLIS